MTTRRKPSQPKGDEPYVFRPKNWTPGIKDRAVALQRAAGAFYWEIERALDEGFLTENEAERFATMTTSLQNQLIGRVLGRERTVWERLRRDR